MTAPTADVRQKLNTETARIGWKEVERHYASGALITVDPGLDLIEVAAVMAEDNASQLQQWLAEDRLRRTSADEAEHWGGTEAEFWCVVVAPWVLVQPIR